MNENKIDKKKLLFVSTHYRVGEKLFGLIPPLSEHFEIDVYFLGMMSLNSKWDGDIDMRKILINRITPYINKTIMGEYTYQFRGDRNWLTQSRNILNYINVEDYDIILYDDSREQPKLQISTIFNEAKKHGIPMIGNSHGNHDHIRRLYEAFGKCYNYAFVMSNPEKNDYTKWFDKERLLVGGIPTNDELKEYEVNPKHLLVITNFLQIQNSMFKSNFNKKWATTIEKISEEYNLPIIIKQKTRTDDPNFKKNSNFIRNLFTKEVTVINNSVDINQLICDSKIVISALSTLAIKPIQKKIPTIIIKDSGQLGNFKNYPYICDIEYNIISEKLKDFHITDDNIERLLKGGSTFQSCDFYIKELKKLF